MPLMIIEIAGCPSIETCRDEINVARYVAFNAGRHARFRIPRQAQGTV